MLSKCILLLAVHFIAGIGCHYLVLWNHYKVNFVSSAASIALLNYSKVCL